MLTFHQAYSAAIAADAAYHAALVAEYGPSKRRVSDMRYRLHAEMDYPPALRALWQAKRDADEAMRAALAAQNAR